MHVCIVSAAEIQLDVEGALWFMVSSCRVEYH